MILYDVLDCIQWNGTYWRQESWKWYPFEKSLILCLKVFKGRNFSLTANKLKDISPEHSSLAFSRKGHSFQPVAKKVSVIIRLYMELLVA